MAIPFEFPFLHHCTKIIMHSNCILESTKNLIVRHILFVGNVQKSPITSHLKGFDLSFEFCCQGSTLTGIKEGG